MQHGLSGNHRRRKDFVALPEWQQRLLPDYLDLLAELDARFITNQALLDTIAGFAERAFFDDVPGDLCETGSNQLASEADYEKVKSCLRQLVREWSRQVRYVFGFPFQKLV